MEENQNYKPESKILNFISNTASICCFAVGFVGLDIVAVIFSSIAKLFINTDNLSENQITSVGGYINLLAYATIFVILVAILQLPEAKRIIQSFRKGKTWLKGLVYGFTLLAISLALSYIAEIIYPTVSANQNESSLESIISLLPIGAFIFIVLLAPICEEITYRYSLFGFLYKKNKYLAYGVCTLIFGLIHCSLSSFGEMTKEEIINELVNLPSYMVSGAFLCFVFDNENDLCCSIIAHSTNNLVAFISALAVNEVRLLSLIR